MLLFLSFNSPSEASPQASSPARNIPTQQQPAANREISSQNYLKCFLGLRKPDELLLFLLKLIIVHLIPPYYTEIEKPSPTLEQL